MDLFATGFGQELSGIVKEKERKKRSKKSARFNDNAYDMDMVNGETFKKKKGEEKEETRKLKGKKNF